MQIDPVKHAFPYHNVIIVLQFTESLCGPLATFQHVLVCEK